MRTPQAEVDHCIGVLQEMLASLQQDPSNELLQALYNEYALNLWVFAEHYKITMMSVECYEATWERLKKQQK